jgi:hypothetical protein
LAHQEVTPSKHGNAGTGPLSEVGCTASGRLNNATRLDRVAAFLVSNRVFFLLFFIRIFYYQSKPGLLNEFQAEPEPSRVFRETKKAEPSRADILRKKAEPSRHVRCFISKKTKNNETADISDIFLIHFFLMNQSTRLSGRKTWKTMLTVSPTEKTVYPIEKQC